MFCAIAVADRRRSSTSSSPLPSPAHETPFTLTVQMLPNEVRLSSKNGKPSSPIIKLASKSDDLQEETDGRGRLVVQSRFKESMQAWTDGLVRQLHRKKLEVCHACFSGLPYMGSDHLICFNEPSRPWLISSFALVPKLRQSSTRLFSFDLRKMFGALPFRVLRQWILTQSLIAPTSSRCSETKLRPHASRGNRQSSWAACQSPRRTHRRYVSVYRGR